MAEGVEPNDGADCSRGGHDCKVSQGPARPVGESLQAGSRSLGGGGAAAGWKEPIGGPGISNRRREQAASKSQQSCSGRLQMDRLQMQSWSDSFDCTMSLLCGVLHPVLLRGGMRAMQRLLSSRLVYVFSKRGLG